MAKPKAEGDVEVEDVKTVVAEEPKYDPYVGYSNFLTYTYSAQERELLSLVPFHDQKVGGFVDAGYRVVAVDTWKEGINDQITYTSWIRLARDA